MKKSIQFFVFLLIMSCAVSVSHALADTKHRDIMLQAAQYIAERLNEDAFYVDDEQVTTKVQPQKLDPRTHIEDCTQYTFAVAPDELLQKHITVKISCSDKEWSMFGFIRVHRTKDIIVANGNMAPGDLLTTNNVSILATPVEQIRGSVFYTIEDVIGTRVNRRTRAGTILTQNLVCHVCEGDKVDIIASAGGLAIKTEGIALESGAKGATIAIQNLRSEKTIMAKVSNVAQVNVSI